VDLELPERVRIFESRFGRDPNSPRLSNSLGVQYARFGRYPRAIEYFLKATELDVDYTAPWINLGHIAALTGDHVAAVIYYDIARDRGANSVALLIGLATSHQEIGNLKEATEFYELASQIDPSIVDRFAFLGHPDDEDARSSQIQPREIIWDEDLAPVQ